jgi:hypothetical protein
MGRPTDAGGDTDDSKWGPDQKRYEAGRHSLFFSEPKCQDMFQNHMKFIVNRKVGRWGRFWGMTAAGVPGVRLLSLELRCGCRHHNPRLGPWSCPPPPAFGWLPAAPPPLPMHTCLHARRAAVVTRGWGPPRRPGISAMSFWHFETRAALPPPQNSVNGRVYKSDPTILAWNLVNEPRCEVWVTPDCPAKLNAWFSKMAKFLKAEVGARAWSGGSQYPWPRALRATSQKGQLSAHGVRRRSAPLPACSRAGAKPPAHGPDERFCSRRTHQALLQPACARAPRPVPPTHGLTFALQDPNHLVSSGSEGFFGDSDPSWLGKNPGAWSTQTGQDFLANTADMDFAVAHAWPDNWMMWVAGRTPAAKHAAFRLQPSASSPPPAASFFAEFACLGMAVMMLICMCAPFDRPPFAIDSWYRMRRLRHPTSPHSSQESQGGFLQQWLKSHLDAAKSIGKPLLVSAHRGPPTPLPPPQLDRSLPRLPATM